MIIIAKDVIYIRGSVTVFDDGSSVDDTVSQFSVQVACLPASSPTPRMVDLDD